MHLLDDMGENKGRRVEQDTSRPTVLRRSSRIAQLLMTQSQHPPLPYKQLPSPTPSAPRPSQTSRRKRHFEHERDASQDRDPKRLRRQGSCSPAPCSSTYDEVAYWVEHNRWPTRMMQKQKQGQGQGHILSAKRKNTSTHHSEKEHRLQQHGIYMRASTLLQSQSKQFCEDLLEGDHKPSCCPCYPVECIEDVLERVHGINEARLQRDIMPWVVPSPENLCFSGKTDLDFIGEEIDAEWNRCETMGLSRPKPDFTVGLKRSAFPTEDLDKLENYGTLQQPFYFTPSLCLPFLICEAKTGRSGIDLADTQNIHSASIATKAILSLYVQTFGRDHEKTKDLLGRILVFTVSHNNRIVNLYGHYAVRAGGDMDEGAGAPTELFQYHRYDIAMFSLGMHGRDRFKAYNFVRNLYSTFASEHRERILAATRCMPKPATRTGISFAASEITLDEESSQPSSDIASQEDETFKTPSEPASASQKREMAKMSNQIDRLLQQMEAQRKESKEQLEQQRRESKEQLEQQRRESKEQLEQQKKESKEKSEILERQMQQMVDLLSSQASKT